ncbi:hypothetical protein [Asticcacaulis benevestitus]|uniref:YcxB-like protein domain-containing protein n=1 Tax=Asticcacaulis benevestitus DSM 16100 = ATCC BAA-896 TaxID=1121022 RepID=V4PBQ7_9CAUL|nr:hypothetical protein [Asticcacaulis benevestitus]ESQ85531.1 hypothetical protein ABENE_18670 [Asticcacaulis benevestitus DSM 16100 = ATCC BAA-896]
MTEHFQAIGYKLKLENYNGFFKAWLKKNYVTKFKLLIVLAYAAFLAAIPWTNRGWAHFDIASIITCILFSALLVFVIIPLVTYLLTVAQYFSGGTSKKENSIEISSAGVVKSSDTTRIELKWTAIHDVIETQKTILLFTN